MAARDSFFKQRFNTAKCKTLVKLTIPRIKLLRNRRESQLKQMRRDIAKLLETGQEATARIRVEHILREEKMLAAQEIVELFCELISVRLPIIEAQRECPLDLKEAISSVCFAAPRCSDLPELLQVQMLFAGKYGKEFVAAATELMPECGVNRQVVELLSVRAPAPDVKLKLLKEIAEEHQLDWDASASEKELLKPHEDLLSGPSAFISKEEKLGEIRTTNSEPAAREQPDPDEDLIFPEVPNKQPFESNKGTTTVPEMFPFPASALSEIDDDDHDENLSHIEDKSVSKNDGSSRTNVEEKQFLPFISPPSQSYAIDHNAKAQYNMVDLQDVLAAARAAAETAERAAVAARAAANIAELRINYLVEKNNDEVSPNPSRLAKSKSDEPNIDDLYKQNLFIDSNNGRKDKNDSSLYGDHSDHQPRRLPSMDDETSLSSYPNLFTSQGSNLSSPPTQTYTDLK